MAEYTVYYTLKLEGELTFDASSSEEAAEYVESLADADLMEGIELGTGKVRIVDTYTDASALEQIADQAEE